MRDSISTQFRNAQPLDKLLHPSDAIFCGRVLPLLVSMRATISISFHAEIRLHTVRENRSADRAVRGVEHPADRRGESMHNTEPRVGQRESTKQTRI